MARKFKRGDIVQWISTYPRWVGQVTSLYFGQCMIKFNHPQKINQWIYEDKLNHAPFAEKVKFKLGEL